VHEQLSDRRDQAATRGSYFQCDLSIGCGNCAVAWPYDNIAMIDTPTFDQARALEAHTMGDPNFFRPYPVASHDVGESGLCSSCSAASTRGKANAAGTVAGVDGAQHAPAAFPIKSDLCDGLPRSQLPDRRRDPERPAELFGQTGAVSVGSRVRKAKGGSD